MSGPQNTPRPCPFCRATWEGSDLTVRHDGRDHLVVCRSCGARGPATEERGMALDLWNGVRRGGDLGADQSDLVVGASGVLGRYREQVVEVDPAAYSRDLLIRRLRYFAPLVDLADTLVGIVHTERVGETDTAEGLRSQLPALREAAEAPRWKDYSNTPRAGAHDG